MQEIFRNHLTFGQFGNGFYTHQALLYGDFPPPTSAAGVYLLFRGEDGEIDYDNIVGSFGEGDETLTIYQDYPFETNWSYVVCALSPYGLYLSDPSEEAVIQIDDDGDMVPPIGNPPTALWAEPLAGGLIKVHWTYDSLYQPAAPIGFRVYMDVGGSWVQQGGAAFDSRKGSYDWTSGALTHETEYTFQVRTYTVIGESLEYELDSDDSITATADALGPAVIADVELTDPEWE